MKSIWFFSNFRFIFHFLNSIFSIVSIYFPKMYVIMVWMKIRNTFSKFWRMFFNKCYFLFPFYFSKLQFFLRFNHLLTQKQVCFINPFARYGANEKRINQSIAKNFNFLLFCITNETNGCEHYFYKMLKNVSPLILLKTSNIVSKSKSKSNDST